MAWKQKINAKTFATASALALCLAVGSNAYAADASVNAEVNASSSVQARYEESAAEAQSRNEAGANADIRAESDGRSANAEAGAQSASSTSTGVNNRDDRGEEADPAEDSNTAGSNRSQQAANQTASLSSDNGATAVTEYGSSTATQRIGSVTHTAISNGRQASVGATTDTRNSVNAALKAMPDGGTNTGANQELEPPASEGLQLAGNTDLVGEAAAAVAAMPTIKGEEVSANAVDTPTTPDGIHSVAVVTSAASEALRVLTAESESYPANGTEVPTADMPAAPDQPMAGNADLLASTAGRAFMAIDAQGDNNSVAATEAPALPDSNLDSRADLTNSVVSQMNGTLQSDSGKVAGHAAATVSTATTAAANAQVAEQAAAAVQSAVTSDIGGAVNADVANDVRDAISSEIVSDISNSLPLPGKL